jgi:putative endonuclease
VPWIYILLCRDGTYYTGATKDLERRLQQHQAGHASRYTRARLPVAIAWSSRCRTWSRTLSEEYRIKQLTRSEKAALVGKAKPPKRRRKGGVS